VSIEQTRNELGRSKEAVKTFDIFTARKKEPVMNPEQKIQQILKERGSRYGDFKGHAQITQSIKVAMSRTAKWHELTDSQREALEMVAHKIGRILNGDPDYLDSWVDIGGYVQLVIDQLKAR
jgi:Domain of unknown function (DUF6378)